MSKDLACCESPEELIEKLIKEKTACACGNFQIPDQSKVENPENPNKEINSSLLKYLEKKGKKLGIVSIGYVKIPVNVLDKNELKYSNAIVLTYPINMDIINEIPSEKTQRLNDILYAKFGNITYELSDYLRKEGYGTQAIHPMEGTIDFSKLGEDAKIGYIGKNRLLISPELGPRLKISAILTSIENLPYTDKNPYEWIRNYCKRCSKCIKRCPQDALIEKEDKIAKANLSCEKCIGCSQGCTYCIEACPFFENGYDWVYEKQTKLEAKLKEKGKL